MTNLQRIQNMTVKEMAEFLKGIKSGTDLAYGEYVYIDYTIFSTKSHIVKWLDSECEV